MGRDNFFCEIYANCACLKVHGTWHCVTAISLKADTFCDIIFASQVNKAQLKKTLQEKILSFKGFPLLIERGAVSEWLERLGYGAGS